MAFSEPMDRYQLFKLAREDWTRWVSLPEGYSFMEEVDREGERALLQSEFPHWEIPFERRLPGLTERGVFCVAYEGEVVGISYGCTENELGLEHYGQIHYAAVAPAHRGKDLLAAMVTEMFRRFPDFKGGIFYVDRSGHQQMYERWGGSLEGEKPKTAPATPTTGLLARLRRKLSGAR
jgi:hypothetical protein